VIIIQKLLEKLFDFQRYERNKDLKMLIDEVENTYQEVTLSDTELSFVAGGVKQEEVKEDKGETKS